MADSPIDQLVLIRGGREMMFDLLERITVIGSDPDAGIKVTGPTILAMHCKIVREDGAIRVVDLSGAGILVNGEKTTERALKSGDVVAVGDAHIKYVAGKPATSAAAPASAPAKAAPAKPAVARTAGARTAGARPAARASGKPAPGAAPRAPRPARARTAGAPTIGPDGEELPPQPIGKRKTKMSPTAALYSGLGITVVLFAIFFWWYQGMDEDSSVHDQQKVIQNFINDNRFEEAQAVIDTIKPGDPNYDFALAAERSMRKPPPKGGDVKAVADFSFETEIKDYVDLRVESKDPKYAGRTGFVRQLMKRVDTWLAAHPDHPKAGEARAIQSKYSPLVPATPPTADDIVIESESDVEFREFGHGVIILNDWMAKNGDSDPAGLALVKAAKTHLLNELQAWFKFIDMTGNDYYAQKDYKAAVKLFKDAEKKLIGVGDIHDACVRRLNQAQRAASGEIDPESGAEK